MSLFTLLHHRLSLSKIDPLGGGLAEEIAAEQQEAEAITLEEAPDANSLSEQWQHVVDEVEKDPDWFTFADKE
jgi:hypothetical protein